MATNVKGLRYFYQVDRHGNPIPGSNTKLKRRPIVNGKGQKWVEYTPYNTSFPCCSGGGLTVTSVGKPWRYYVRLASGATLSQNPEPISGTLEKHKFKPASYGWQEVVGVHQCATQPQFNATYTWTGTSPKTINLATLLAPIVGSNTFVAYTGATTQTHMNLVLNTAGSLAITQVNAANSNTDTITLQYTNGTCNFAFRLTLAFTHS